MKTLNVYAQSEAYLMLFFPSRKRTG